MEKTRWRLSIFRISIKNFVYDNFDFCRIFKLKRLEFLILQHFHIFRPSFSLKWESISLNLKNSRSKRPNIRLKRIIILLLPPFPLLSNLRSHIINRPLEPCLSSAIGLLFHFFRRPKVSQLDLISLV